MAETWVLNATVTLPSFKLSGIFTSTGHSYLGISGDNKQLYYIAGSSLKSVYNRSAGWTNDSYRTLVFDTSPTGNLLTWLQANGVKQSDPEPETPTNSCMVDGTVYGIKNGQTLVNGTARTIYNGRTLLAGAGYDIVLSTSGFTVTITGNGAPASEPINAYVIINGVSYTAPATLTVEAGTTIEAHASNMFGQSIITLNGEQIRSGTKISYEHPVTTNTNVELIVARSGTQVYSRVAITATWEAL